MHSSQRISTRIPSVSVAASLVRLLVSDIHRRHSVELFYDDIPFRCGWRSRLPLSPLTILISYHAHCDTSLFNLTIFNLFLFRIAVNLDPYSNSLSTWVPSSPSSFHTAHSSTGSSPASIRSQAAEKSDLWVSKNLPRSTSQASGSTGNALIFPTTDVPFEIQSSAEFSGTSPSELSSSLPRLRITLPRGISSTEKVYEFKIPNKSRRRNEQLADESTSHMQPVPRSEMERSHPRSISLVPTAIANGIDITEKMSGNQRVKGFQNSPNMFASTLPSKIEDHPRNFDKASLSSHTSDKLHRHLFQSDTDSPPPSPGFQRLSMSSKVSTVGPMSRASSTSEVASTLPSLSPNLLPDSASEKTENKNFQINAHSTVDSASFDPGFDRYYSANLDNASAGVMSTTQLPIRNNKNYLIPPYAEIPNGHPESGFDEFSTFDPNFYLPRTSMQGQFGANGHIPENKVTDFIPAVQAPIASYTVSQQSDQIFDNLRSQMTTNGQQSTEHQGGSREFVEAKGDIGPQLFQHGYDPSTNLDSLHPYQARDNLQKKLASHDSPLYYTDQAAHPNFKVVDSGEPSKLVIKQDNNGGDNFEFGQQVNGFKHIDSRGPEGRNKGLPGLNNQGISVSHFSAQQEVQQRLPELQTKQFQDFADITNRRVKPLPELNAQESKELDVKPPVLRNMELEQTQPINGPDSTVVPSRPIDQARGPGIANARHSPSEAKDRGSVHGSNRSESSRYRHNSHQRPASLSYDLWRLREHERDRESSRHRLSELERNQDRVVERTRDLERQLDRIRDHEQYRDRSSVVVVPGSSGTNVNYPGISPIPLSTESNCGRIHAKRVEQVEKKFEELLADSSKQRVLLEREKEELGSKNQQLTSEKNKLTQDTKAERERLEAKIKELESTINSGSKLITFFNATIDKQWQFPLSKVNTWQRLQTYLLQAFPRSYGGYIKAGSFEIRLASEQKLIIPSLWAELVEAGKEYEIILHPIGDSQYTGDRGSDSKQRRPGQNARPTMKSFKEWFTESDKLAKTKNSKGYKFQL
ncbi:uncharacterized protein V1516DRAFT_666368 [Lipomyces oligophaga]|uniref:uncharacterized protein n=1 Tax=Lipomyces oligophaga TaxID=45792 RepID=UPI0034CD8D83